MCEEEEEEHRRVVGGMMFKSWRIRSVVWEMLVEVDAPEVVRDKSRGSTEVFEVVKE